MVVHASADAHAAPPSRIRRDLEISYPNGPLDDSRVVVKHPLTGERFEFDAHAMHLVRALDGRMSVGRIVTSFNARFDAEICSDDVYRFIAQAGEMGLLESPAHDFSGQDDGFATSIDTEVNGEHRAEAAADADETFRKLRDDPYRWPLVDPSGLFTVLNAALSPLRLFWLAALIALIPALPLALLTVLQNQHLLWLDLAAVGQSRSYFARLVFSLFAFNLLRCLIQGTLIAHYGGAARAFGIRLRFGIIPRFFIDKSAIRKFDRHAKLWTYGSNPLFRVALIVIGAFTWFIFRGSGTQLAANAIVLTHAALISLLLVCLPVRASDGYRWLMTYFRLPLTTMKLAVLTLSAQVTRRQLPTSVSPQQRRRLLFYGIALIIFWVFAFVRISGHIIAGLTATFPNIFGGATEVILTLLVLFLMLRWVLYRFRRLHGGRSGQGEVEADPMSSEIAERGASGPERQPAKWPSVVLRASLLAALAVALALPVPFRPGGPVSLLPPVQQDIAAPISGKIVQVRYQGGNGRLITKGEPVAAMVSTELQHEAASLKEQIDAREAALKKFQAQLAKVSAGPKPEAVEQAQARVAQAESEVEIARHELETAEVTSMHSDDELERMQRLPAGLISEIDIARSAKQADVDRLRIREAEEKVAAQRKALEEAQAEHALLTSGATAEELDIARQEVAEAAATLRSLREELAYVQSKLADSELRMPFDGYLVEPYLRQHLGSYLGQGDTFATAQARQRPLVEMVLPEYDVGAVDLGSRAEVKLMAYPERPYAGKVTAIEPAGTESGFGRTFNLVIELQDAPESLKPGMSGYGKIASGQQPLAILLARPIARFFQVEVWSWIP